MTSWHERDSGILVPDYYRQPSRGVQHWGACVPRAMITAGLFNPAQVPNLKVSLDADLDVTIATGVSAWADQSGNGNNVSQATGSAQMARASNWRNGHAALTGAAGKWIAGTYGVALAANCTIYSVLQWPSTVAAQRMAYDGIGASNRILFACDNAVALNPASLLYSGAGMSTGSIPSGPVIVRNEFNGASSTSRIEPHGAAVVTATGNPGTQTALGLTVGANYLGGSPFEGGGQVANILIYTGAVSAANDAAIFAFLARKYNIVHT